MFPKRYGVSRRSFNVWKHCPHLKIRIWLMKMKASCFLRTSSRSGRVQAESPRGDGERGPHPQGECPAGHRAPSLPHHRSAGILQAIELCAPTCVSQNVLH